MPVFELDISGSESERDRSRSPERAGAVGHTYASYERGGRPSSAVALVLRGGSPPRTLRGPVGSAGQLSLLTAYGDPVKALAAGTYTLTVRDASAKHGFLPTPPPGWPRFVTRSTGLRFRGTVTWTVKLRAGWYRVAVKGPRTVGREFPVLSPGG